MGACCKKKKKKEERNKFWGQKTKAALHPARVPHTTVFLASNPVPRAEPTAEGADISAGLNPPELCAGC